MSLPSDIKTIHGPKATGDQQILCHLPPRHDMWQETAATILVTPVPAASDRFGLAQGDD
jgi:hypothetical protein